MQWTLQPYNTGYTFNTYSYYKHSGNAEVYTNHMKIN